MKLKGSLESIRSHRLEVYDLGIQTLSNALVRLDLVYEGKIPFTESEQLSLIIDVERAILCMHELFLDADAHKDRKYTYAELCEIINTETEWNADDEYTAYPISKEKAKLTMARLFRTLKGQLLEQSKYRDKLINDKLSMETVRTRQTTTHKESLLLDGEREDTNTK